MPRVHVVTPPGPILTLDVAKAHLRVDHDVEDDLIAAYVATVSAQLDGPDGWLGWALGTQRLELRASRFYREGMFLPCGPVTAVVEATYLDPDGGEQTLPAEAYGLHGDQLFHARSHSWPATLWRPESVRIRYDAGPAPAAILTIVQQAARLMVEDAYRHRGTVAAGVVTAVPMSGTVQNLLNPIRRWIS